MELSAMGLEPDGRRAHLVPYKDECTLLLDYKGIAELVRRYADVVHIHCDVVGENDHFEYRFGTGGKLEHVPSISDRGRIYCAYSYVRLKDGSEEFDVMGTEDIERTRSRSRAANDGPWVTDWNEMAKKTVFRRHSKTLPLSPDLRDAIEHDDEVYTEQERFAAARPAAASVAAAPKLPRARETKPAPLDLSFDNHQEQEEYAPEPPTPPVPMSAEVPEAAAVEQEEAPQRPLADQVGEMLANDGYSVADLLAVLREVRLVNAGVESLAQCPPNALQTVLDDWENCKRRLNSKKVAP
jgi:recombinational DNA repair protein RecT